MWTVRLLAHVPPDKRHEFVESAHDLPAQEPSALTRILVLQDRRDPSLFCWMGEGSTADGLESFLHSPGFRALKGAAEVLGGIEELRVLEDRPSGSGRTPGPPDRRE